MKSDDVMRVNALELEYESGGDRRIYNGELFTGISYLVDEVTGNVIKEWPYLNGYPNGVCKKWYPNAQLQEIYHIDNEVGAGGEMIWHPNGRLKSVLIEEYGSQISYTEWDEKGCFVREYELDKKSPEYDYILKRRREDMQTSDG